jgi:photosystem II stability/assembly factor-like uncharacterized protein
VVDLRVRSWAVAVLCAAALFLTAAGALGRAAPDAIANVYVVHVADPESVIVAGSEGVLATADAGARWHDITPSTMSGVLVSHIVDIESFGTARIWLEPVGDMRMDFVPSTDNGGATWSSGVLPGSAGLDGSPLSFWTPERGRAIGERNGGAIGVYQTDDGGASWKQVAGATPGPFGGPVTFTSASTGWTWDGGGLMYRTEDRGRTWQQVRLPALSGYRLVAADQPQFFGGEVGIVIARLRGAGSAARTAFYASEDGGASWHPQLAPHASGRVSGAYAADASDWFAMIGAELFGTSDAGKTWHEKTVQVPTGLSIDAIDYLSPTLGWAEAAGPPIGDLYPTYLLRTTDGGRDWSKIDFQR